MLKTTGTITQPARRPPARRVVLCLALIAALAAFLRFYRLDTLPPGLFADETLVSLLARQVVAQRWLPLYFPQSFGGYHPAIVYLTVLARWVTGGDPLAVRFGVAAAGVASVPVFFLALRAVFQLDHPEARATHLALLGALILSFMFPAVAISRLGFEVMLPAPIGAMVFGLLAVGLRTGQRRYVGLAGAALGLSLYTYYSARLLPLAVAGALLWVALAAGRAAWRGRALDLALVAAVSLLVFAPLGLYFWQHPDQFLARATATTGGVLQGGSAAVALHLLVAGLRTLGSLSLPGFGDQLARHNLPGRPVFDAFLSVLFWIGLILALRRARQRSAAVLVAWWAVMLLPVIVTFENNAPHFTRMQGALPAMAGLAALGGVALWEVVAASQRLWATGILAFGLVFSLASSTYDYFVRWANWPTLFDAFQVGDWRAAHLARQSVAMGGVYLSPELISDPAHPDFDLLLRGGAVRDFPGPNCLVVVDQPPRPLTYIVDALRDPATLDRLQAMYPTGRPGPAIMHAPEPWPLFIVFNVPAGAPLVPPEQRSAAQFGAGIVLAGYAVSPATLRPGETFTVTLRWTALTAPAADYNVFVHLYLPGGENQTPGVSAEPVAQSDSAPCQGGWTTSRWQPSETVIDVHTLTLPPDYAPDHAVLAIGLYNWATLDRQAISGGGSVLSDHRLKLGDLPVGP